MGRLINPALTLLVPIAMKIEYHCIDCNKAFPVEVTDEEYKTVLSEAHPELCPECGRRVGTGNVQCQACGNEFVLHFAHWHIMCDLAGGNCPKCGNNYVSLCIC